MVLSSWQSHCERSPGSFDECRLSAKVAANPQTKPTDLDCESARKKWQNGGGKMGMAVEDTRWIGLRRPSVDVGASTTLTACCDLDL